MVEKNFETPVKERFDFVLSINGNIICQRNFGINNFQEKSLGSVHLTEAVEECMEMIDKDLKEKTNVYNWLTAPQVFQNIEEMNAWVAKHPHKLSVPEFVTLRDADEAFLWDGEKMTPYPKSVSRPDYVEEEDDTPWILKFAFLDNGEEVRSISWDGKRYPKFIRANIDISNSRNKFKTEQFSSPYWALVVDELNDGRNDLIPQIKRRLIYACTGTTVRYFSKVRYGSIEEGNYKEYDLNLKGYNERLFLDMKKKR